MNENLKTHPIGERAIPYTNNANALHKINQQAPQGFIYLFIFTPNSYNNGRKGIQTLAFLIIEKVDYSIELQA